MSSELLLTFFVALVVFGPNKLPHLARVLAIIFKQITQFKNHLDSYFQQAIKEQQLAENEKEAERVDGLYKQFEKD